MSAAEYPDRVWITPPADGNAPTVTSCARDEAKEYIRADIARDAIRLVVSVAEGFGLNPDELLAVLQKIEVKS